MVKVTSWSNYKEVYCRTKYFKKSGLRMMLYVLLQKFLEDYVEVEECKNAGSVPKKKLLKIKKPGKSQ